MTRSKCGLEDIVFIRIYSPLDDRLTQAPGARGEDDIPEPGFGIERKVTPLAERSERTIFMTPTDKKTLK